MSYKPIYYKYIDIDLNGNEDHFFVSYDLETKSIYFERDINDDNELPIALNITHLDKFIELLQKIKEENK